MTRSNSNIWQLQSRGDVAAIIKALDITDPKVRSRAVMALEALGAKEAVPQLKMLRSREVNPEIRSLIDQALLALSSDPEQPAAEHPTDFLKAIQGKDVDAAVHAVKQLGILGDRSIIEYLVILFRESTQPSRLRLAAAEALLQLESAPASASLLGALHKSDWQIRRNAAAILGQLKADWAVEPLKEVMEQDSNPVVRRTAAAALRHIKTPEAIQALQHAPSD